MYSSTISTASFQAEYKARMHRRLRARWGTAVASSDPREVLHLVRGLSAADARDPKVRRAAKASLLLVRARTAGHSRLAQRLITVIEEALDVG
jgi:hypothetical protein